ncbi:MAG: tryptophan--tRNA ligase [Lysobacteraceae bacterium]|nr:MAG: tryptophan--tRNA ligase [Xanthomonadaceae bacterium]
MERVLTGITTTGTPHLGNYVGAIRPAVAASHRKGVESFLFLADYHALVKCDDPARVARSRLEIAATWLAAGLDPARAVFYRQSDIPEIPELAWMLACVAAKGLLNRAHAYKAAVDANLAAGEDADAGVSMGLYGYPVLMAADILLFNAHKVPVGRDQIQHIEMARDFAQRFNHLYGGGQALFVLPEAQVEAQVAVLPGLDGRKMSKSYDNTIPLFEGGARATLEAIRRIVTDSRAPGEPKQPEGTALMTIFEAFASAEESRAFAEDLRAGLGWGEAKQRLAARIEEELAPMRERYAALMARPQEIEDILREGARRARAVATPFMARLREAVGLGRLSGAASAAPRKADGARAAAARPAVKQYREADGRFYFKLVDGEGRLLARSRGFEQPREAGAAIAALRAAPATAPLEVLEAEPGVDEARLRATLAALG